MDTLKEKLSKAAKPAVDYATKLYSDTKGLFAPLENEAKGIQAKGQNIGDYKRANPDEPKKPQAKPNSYKKGGMVKKSGVAMVHKGERVLTTKQTKKMSKKGGFGKLFGDSDKDGK